MGSWVKRTHNESITRNITRTCEKPYYISILQGFDSPQVHEKGNLKKSRFPFIMRVSGNFKKVIMFHENG